MAKAVAQEAKPAERLSRARQRLKLIDACITALHQHGPSRTTIDKVVSIADMSPGIVNFYFETKAALLVAALEHLAVEFETAVLEPLAALRQTPVAALDRLIELYLDPEVASARKVSVWYSFWGESSSRREYFTICGKRDEAFAALVQDLVARLIRQTRLAHLDADAVALGLIGCLEMMWQEIAFKDEAELDREGAKKRCRAYLRSVFPGHFSATVVRISAGAEAQGALRPVAYASDEIFAAELKMFRRCWQFGCCESDISQPGAYVAWHSAIDRSLLVRGADLRIRGFVNTCLHRPHVLVAGDSGALGAQIACGADGTQYGLDGVLLGAESPACLTALSVSVTDGVVLVNHAAEAPGAPPCLGVGMLSSFGGWRDFALEADWKLVVEHWADTYFDGTARVIGACSGPSDVVVGKAGVSCVWPIDEAGTSGVTRLLYARLAYASGVVGCRVERRLIWPNMFVEQRPDGATVRQVLPVAAGRSRLRLRQYRGASADRAMRAMGYLAARIGRAWEREDARLIESTQAGLEWQEDFGEKGGVALRAFFGWLRGAVPGCYQ